MLFFKKKIYSNLYIFFLILIFIIIEFSTNITYSKNLIISDIEIEESYDLNFNKNKVLDKGFSVAFKNLIYKTIETKDRYKFEKTSIKKKLKV